MYAYRWLFRTVSAAVLTGSVGAAAAQEALPEIHVQSSAQVASGNPDFTSVTTMSSDEALTKGASSLGDLLGNRPGVSQSAFAPAASRPVIRGLAGFRVRTQENGVGSHDMANLGEDHAVTIDPLLAGQVEVIRGPGTLLYGSQAIGGVVSATNSRIPTSVPVNGMRFESRGAYNSVSYGKEGAALLEAGGKNIAIHADAFQRRADDYAIPGGRQTNSSLKGEGNAFGSSYIFEDGFFGAAFQRNVTSYHIPGIASSAEGNHIDLWQTKWTSRGERRVREGWLDTLKYWFGASDYKHHEVNVVNGANVVGSVFKNKELEARVEASHMPVQTALGEMRGVFGAQWGDRQLSAVKTSGILLAPAAVKSLAAFVFEEVRLNDDWRAQAAARIDRISVDGVGATFPSNFLPPPDTPAEFGVKRTFLPVSVSAGLLRYFPHDIVGRITAQHVERAPDAIELFYKGPHDTPRTFEIGDPNMNIEKANTVELGLKRNKGEFRFEASVYYTQFKNFIFKNFTGVRCADTFVTCGAAGATFDQIIYSQRDANFFGAEIQGEYDVGRVWRGIWGVEAQYDFVDARFKDGSYVPKIPPHRAGGGLYYRDENWTARVHLLHAFSQNRLGAFETPTPGYNMLNAELSHTKRYTGEVFVPEVTVGIKGENLLNDQIRLHQSYKKDEVLQPGLNVRAFASFKLN